MSLTPRDIADTFLVAGGFAALFCVVMSMSLGGRRGLFPGKRIDIKEEKKLPFGGLLGFLKKLLKFSIGCLLIGGLMHLILWLGGWR